MAYEPGNGDGALFPNKYKEGDDNKPNVTGYIVAHRDIKAGERVRLAAWTKTSDKGKFQSLKMSDPKEQSGGEPTPDEPPF